jgi:hypothetical protein
VGDVVAGVPVDSYATDATAGTLLVWPGGQGAAIELSQASETVKGNDQPGDEFGAAIAVADLDRDSFADIVVGAPGEGNSVGTELEFPDEGRVTIVRGGPGAVPPANGPVYSLDTPGVRGAAGPGRRFGAALALLDEDGDGRRPDLVVTAPGGEPSLLRLPGRPGGFTGSGATGLLPAGGTSLWVG